jgi:hypothetical protein
LVNRHATFNISIDHPQPVGGGIDKCDIELKTLSQQLRCHGTEPIGAKVLIPAYTKPKLDGSVKEILKEVREIMGNPGHG